MIRTGDEYRESIRDGREVWINGERVADVTSHPMFKPLVDVRARIYDMAHDPATREVMTTVDEETGERFAVGPQLPLHAGGLAGQAPRRRRRAGRRRRRGHPRRRRDGRRDVVALRRAGRPQRDRPHLLREHPPPRRVCGPQRPLPRLGQHRPQGRPLQAAAGAGPGHAPARGAGDRRRHRGQRRQVRDGRRLRQPGVRQADDRQLGRQRALRLRGRLHRPDGRAGDEAHLPHRLRRARAAGGLPALQPLRRGRHPHRLRRRATSPGRTSSSTGTRAPPPTSAPRCTATAPSPSCSASCATPT